jgi:hypothetical protein
MDHEFSCTGESRSYDEHERDFDRIPVLVQVHSEKQTLGLNGANFSFHPLTYLKQSIASQFRED